MTQPATTPVDVTAILTALQDQLDDLTTLVEAQRRALVQVETRLLAVERAAAESRT